MRGGLPVRTESPFPLRFPCHSLCHFFAFLSPLADMGSNRRAECRTLTAGDRGRAPGGNGRMSCKDEKTGCRYDPVRPHATG